MKKSLLYFMSIIVNSVICLCVTSCSSDDTDSSTQKFTREMITGVYWYLEDYSIERGQSGVIEKGNYLFFNNDGTCEGFHPMENAYRINDGKIETFYKKTNEPIFVYTLLSQANGLMKVRLQGTLDDDINAVLTLVSKEEKQYRYKYFDYPLLQFDEGVSYIRDNETHTFVKEYDWAGINGNRGLTGRAPYYLQYSYKILGENMEVTYYLPDKDGKGIHHISATYPSSLSDRITDQLDERYGYPSYEGDKMIYKSTKESIKIEVSTISGKGNIDYYPLS